MSEHHEGSNDMVERPNMSADAKRHQDADDDKDWASGAHPR